MAAVVDGRHFRLCPHRARARESLSRIAKLGITLLPDIKGVDMEGNVRLPVDGRNAIRSDSLGTRTVSQIDTGNFRSSTAHRSRMRNLNSGSNGMDDEEWMGSLIMKVFRGIDDDGSNESLSGNRWKISSYI